MTQSPSQSATAIGGAAGVSDEGQPWGRRAGWALLVAALIFYASSRSHVAAPGITRIDDKFGHFGVYGLLGTLVCRLGRGPRGALAAMILVSAYGASDEWHQSFVPGRSTELEDWIADTIGAGLGIGLYAGWSRYRRWLEKPLGRGRKRIEKLPARPRVGRE
jgi:VanZ family protein